MQLKSLAILRKISIFLVFLKSAKKTNSYLQMASMIYQSSQSLQLNIVSVR